MSRREAAARGGEEAEKTMKMMEDSNEMEKRTREQENMRTREHENMRT